MPSSYAKFAFQLFMLALVLSIVGLGLFHFVFPERYFPLYPLIPVSLLTVTLGVHYALLKASEDDPRKFASKYLGAMGLKIMIYLVFLVVILFVDTEHAVPFLVSFLVMYITFTVYEVISILKYLKNR
jgi:hypothetical protein